MSEEIDREHVECLRASKLAMGALEPIDLDAEGHLVNGRHRRVADPEWPAVQHENLKTPVDCAVFRIGKDWQRGTKNDAWKTEQITILARAGKNVTAIVELTGLSERTVYRYMPVEFKNIAKADAGRVGGPAASVATLATRVVELEEAEKKANAVIQECANCLLGFRVDQLTRIGENFYCKGCAPTMNLAYKKEQKRLVKAEEAKKKPVTPRDLDTYKEREAHMKVQHSQEEIRFVKLLEDNHDVFGAVITDREFPAVVSVPDAFLPKHNMVFYVDGKPHEGKEDEDTQLRVLVGKLNHVRVVCYSGKDGKPEDWLKDAKQIVNAKNGKEAKAE